MFPTMMPDVADASSAERPDQEAELFQRAYTRNCYAPLLVRLSRLHIGLVGLQSAEVSLQSLFCSATLGTLVF